MPHNRTSGVRAVVVTALPHVRWKKIEKKILSLFVPLWPLSSGLLPLDQNYLFFCEKKWKKRVIDEECLHQLHRRPKDLCLPCQRTTIDQYQKWRPTISWEVRSRTTVARRRVTKKLAYFVDWSTFGDPLHRCPHWTTTKVWVKVLLPAVKVFSVMGSGGVTWDS